MPLQQTDPLGIRPAQQPPMMQRMGDGPAPFLAAPVSDQQMVQAVNRVPQGSQQGGRPRNTDDLLSALPQMGSPVLDAFTRHTIRQNAPAVNQLLSRPQGRSTLQPTSPSGIASIAPPPSVGRSEPPMAGAAQALASRGRGMPGGPRDSMLVHMNPVEVQALADASPIGGLPINPDTGMPEAFAFLLPMAMGAGGAALGKAGLLGGLGALGGGALGAGLGGFSKGMIEGRSLGDSLLQGVVGGVSSYALGSLFQGMGPDATGIDAAAAGGNQSAMAAQNAAAEGINIMPSPSTSLPGDLASSAAGSGPMLAPPGGPFTAGETSLLNTARSTLANPADIEQNLLGQVFNNPEMGQTMFTPESAALARSVGPTLDPFTQTAASAPNLGNALKDQFTTSALSSPESMGRLGGGLLAEGVVGPVTGQVQSPLRTNKKPYQYTRNDPEPGDTEVTRMSPSRLKNYGRTPEGQHRFFQSRSLNYQEGGLVDAGIGSLDPEGEQELVVNAKLAAIGRHPNPEAALMAYAERFGVEALKQLMRGATLKPGEGEALQGQGGGMADLIPAVIDGEQPARLSSGEVVVPADVVSGVGDGDTEAGAERLKDMMAQIRMAKTGSTQQPMPIDEAMAQA